MAGAKRRIFGIGYFCATIVIAAVIATESSAASDSNKFASIHTVAVVSTLGNQVDVQKQGATRFSYADYKLHADGDLDALIRDCVTKSIQKSFTVRNELIDPQTFPPMNIGTFGRPRLDVTKIRPELDAVIVVYPNAADSTGFVSSGFAVTYDEGFMFHRASTVVAVSFAVGVFDAKTGERIDYGTGRFPASGYLTGTSPAWESCSDSMWAESESALTSEQKTRIHQELWSLVTRSLPYAMASAGLISKLDADGIAATSAAAADPSCHELG